MACPFFYPVERFPESAWPKHPRLPLGDPYSGCCRAGASGEWNPDPSSLREVCNMGYARGRCPRFPESGGPDAYRFSIVTDIGGTLTVFYVAERAHYPLQSGMVEYSSGTDRFSHSIEGDTFQKQARAYIESYLRRKNEPEDEAHHPHRR